MSDALDNQTELARAFAEMAESREASLRNADSKKANTYFEKLVKIVKKADASEHGRACFRPLLTSEKLEVRVAAASTVLALMPSEAVPVLEAAAAERHGAASMAAHVVLAQWREGTFRFP